MLGRGKEGVAGGNVTESARGKEGVVLGLVQFKAASHEAIRGKFCSRLNAGALAERIFGPSLF